MNWLLLLLLSLPAGAQTPSQGEKVLDLKNFRDCGLITRFKPNLINPNCLQQANNVLFDPDGTMTRRGGYAQYNLTACTGAQPIRGLWPFDSTDGSLYLIAYSSGSMFYSKGDGTCNPITGLTSLSLTAQMECVQQLGYLNCTNGIDTPFRTNVASTQTLSSAPFGYHIGAFRNRLLISGVPGSLTRLYLSGELDGTDWGTSTFPTYSTSAVSIDIAGLNDGKGVTCLMGEFQNQFLVGRRNDLFALAGYDNRDFVLRKISSQIGCLDPKSVEEVNNQMIWLSNRGIEGFTGTEIQRISYPIDPTIQAIVASAGNTRSQTFTSQADWQTGNLTASGPGAPMSATLSAGNVVPSTWGVIDAAPFSSGTNNITVFDYSLGAVTLTSTTFGDSFADGNFTTNPVWTLTGTNNSLSAVNSVCLYGATLAQGAGFDLSSPTGISTGSWTVSTSFNNFAGGSSNNPSSYRMTYHFISNTTTESSSSGYALRIDANFGLPNIFSLYRFDAGSAVLLSSGTDSNSTGQGQIFGSTITVVRNSAGVFTLTGTPAQIGPVTDTTYKTSAYQVWTPFLTSVPTTTPARTCLNSISAYNYSSTGTYTSALFNTGLSTPTWGAFSSTFTASADDSIVFYVQSTTNSNGTGLTSIVSASDTLRLNGLAQKQYIRYRADFATTVSTKTPQLSFVNLEAETTGYYITNCVQTNGITSWGNLNVNGVTNNGSFTFWESTGTSCVAATAVNSGWNLQTANAQIAVPLSSFTAVRVLFAIDSGTQAPSLNDITINWNEGASRPPTASARFDDRYYLFYTTSTLAGAINDHAVIYDQNKKWLLWDDVFAYSAALYLNQLFTGDSNSTGLIFQQNSGFSDNGGAFNMSFQTADMDDGNPSMRKNFSRAYMIIAAPDATTTASNINCNYSLDGSSSTYSLGSVTLSESPELSGYFVSKLPFPLGSPSSGHWVNVQCSYLGTNGPVSIHEIKMVYTEEGWE